MCFSLWLVLRATDVCLKVVARRNKRLILSLKFRPSYIAFSVGPQECSEKRVASFLSLVSVKNFLPSWALGRGLGHEISAAQERCNTL